MPFALPKTLFFLLLLCFTQAAFAQNRLDNALRLTGQARLDSLEAFFFNKMCYSDTNTVKKNLVTIQNFAQQKQDKMLLATADYFTALAYTFGGLLDSKKVRQTHLRKALTATEKLATPEGKYLYSHIAIAYGEYLFRIESKQEEALEYLLRADAFYRKIGYANVYGGVRKLRIIGEYYFHLGDIDKTNAYFEEIQTLLNKNTTDLDDWNKIQIYNDIALLEAGRKHYETAIANYKKIAPQVHHPKDSVWIGLAAGNIGVAYLQQLHLPLQAEPYMKMDLAYLRKYTPLDTIGIVASHTGMGLIAAYKKQPEVSKKYFQQALDLKTQCHGCDVGSLNALYRYRIEADTVLNNYHDAVWHTRMYYKTLLEMKKTIYSKTIQEATAKYDTEKYKFNAELAENKAVITKYWLYFWFSMLVMVILSAFFVYNRAKRKQLAAELTRNAAQLHAQEAELRQAAAEQKTLVAQQKNELAALDLQNAQAQLQQFMNNIIQKNEMIEKINTELTDLKTANDTQKTNKTTAKQQIDAHDFYEILQITILTENEWAHFRELFEKVYPDFLLHLQQEYPQLSQADLRLLVLLKLNFTNKQITTTLGISTDSVYKSRYRLRQKLSDLPTDNELVLLLK